MMALLLEVATSGARALAGWPVEAVRALLRGSVARVAAVLPEVEPRGEPLSESEAQALAVVSVERSALGGFGFGL